MTSSNALLSDKKVTASKYLFSQKKKLVSSYVKPKLRISIPDSNFDKLPEVQEEEQNNEELFVPCNPHKEEEELLIMSFPSGKFP